MVRVSSKGRGRDKLRGTGRAWVEVELRGGYGIDMDKCRV